MHTTNYYILLAKSAVKRYIEEKETISPHKDLPSEFFNKKAGVFVTIKKSGKLQGCIGTYLPTKENIAQEIIANAIAAATRDARFETIKKEDIPYLSYSVYILREPEQINSTKELDPKKYGVIVKSVSTKKDSENVEKVGLLLPDLGGVDTIKKQILIACQKGGINLDKEKIIIYRFIVEKHE